MSATKINETSLFKCNLSIRIDDINFGNHLCHSKFVSILHNARALFLKKYGLSEIDCFGHGLIMLNLNINYTSQCVFDDKLEVTIGLHEMKRSAFILSYAITNLTTQKIAAHATTLMGFFDIKKAKLTRIPPEFLALIDSISKDSKPLI